MEAAAPGRGNKNNKGKIFFQTFVAVTMFTVCTVADDFSWSIGASGVLGWYILPDMVAGNVDESESGSYSEASVPASNDENSGFVRNRFRYSHPFDKSTAPNYGFASSVTFKLPNDLIIGAEISRTASIDEHRVRHTYSDTLTKMSYSPIPHEYRVLEIAASDRLYVKSLVGCILLGHRFNLGRGYSLEGLVGIGGAYYRQVMQSTEENVSTKYYDENGNEVFQEEVQPSFRIRGIEYVSVAVVPELRVSRFLSKGFAIETGIGVPLSYVEKGYSWTENNGVNTGKTYYPDGRFVAGNVRLHFGVSVHFAREEEV